MVGAGGVDGGAPRDGAPPKDGEAKSARICHWEGVTGLVTAREARMWRQSNNSSPHRIYVLSNALRALMKAILR